MTLVNLLARHPGVELAQLTSRSFAGHRYQAVFPLLELEGAFREEPDPGSVDVVFSCLPHNVGAARASGWLDAGTRVIDMSADFRLRDAAEYPRWYRQEPPAPAPPREAVDGPPPPPPPAPGRAPPVPAPRCHP